MIFIIFFIQGNFAEITVARIPTRYNDLSELEKRRNVDMSEARFSYLLFSACLGRNESAMLQVWSGWSE